jgi:nucleoside-diphosphate-sugar epimerase
MKSYGQSDLKEIAHNLDPFLSSYSDKTIFIAGATGFIGSWLVSFFDFANKKMDTRFEIIALARTITQDFRGKFIGVKCLEGDVAELDLGCDLNPDLIINAATPSVPNRGGEDAEQILRGSVDGTKNLLRYCLNDKITHFINLSSGIVTKRAKESELNLLFPKDAYLYGKRVSEELVSKATVDGKIIGQNMRLYAFAGPGISLTDHFAVGNFLEDAISGRPINIKGNPATVRSYLYPTDLIINLLKHTKEPNHKTFEIGSSSRVTMQELALVINNVTGNTGIIQGAEYGNVDEYLPAPARNEVTQNIEIEESIMRWVQWLNR